MLCAVEELLDSPRARPDNHISIRAVPAAPRVAFQAAPASLPARGSFSCPTPTSSPLPQIQRQGWVRISDTRLKMVFSLFMETIWDCNNVILENFFPFEQDDSENLCWGTCVLCHVLGGKLLLRNETWQSWNASCPLTYVFHPIYDNMTMEEEANTEGQKELLTKGKLFSLWFLSHFTVNIYTKAFLFLFISPPALF